MLDILWKLLGILGWILLIALLVSLAILLLVLFCPVSYRFYGKKDSDRLEIKGMGRWLLGLVCVNFYYPEPGNAVVRLFGIPVYDTGREKKTSGKKENGREKKASGKKEKTSECPCQSGGPEQSRDGKDPGAEDTPPQPGTDPDSVIQSLRERLKGLKETQNRFFNTFLNLLEKGKAAWKRIRFYFELLTEEDSKLLFSGWMFRVGRILKSVRPRTIRGDLLIGTGSPDTTGYCMAVYGMLSPYLGENITVTPDFEKAILKGELFFCGRIIAAVLLYHMAHILLDRKLYRFMKQLKMEDK